MAQEEKNKLNSDKENKDAVVKPESETLHTTDPQEHMEGPVSSMMQGIKEKAEDEESKESADRRKEENM